VPGPHQPDPRLSHAYGCLLCIRKGSAEAQTWAEALRQHVCKLVAADGVAKADLNRVLQHERELQVGCMLPHRGTQQMAGGLYLSKDSNICGTLTAAVHMLL